MDYKQETNSHVIEEFQSLAINVLGEDRGLKLLNNGVSINKGKEL